LAAAPLLTRVNDMRRAWGETRAIPDPASGHNKG